MLECGETTTRRHLREMRAVGLLPGEAPHADTAQGDLFAWEAGR